eukprot:TRINITY_DN33879_c0_g1_i1.p2 TRINITY_DN33879_c0_g1~~TRINITY_DN33879_c0_g1_i1.p2  ORF type:complete len:102 (-),score=10.79 TRINITY_DN33879_c0_g1_i1:110-415(-)
MGCNTGETCMPIMYDNNGNACPQICYTECKSDELYCSNGLDANGCDMGNTCVPATVSSHNGSTCPGSCPVTCPPDQVQCYPLHGPSGCFPPPVCVAPGQTC